MKILQDLQEYIRYAIETQNIELECIYGSSQHNKVDKETFIRILNYCKQTYKFIDETNTLDIRKQLVQRQRQNIGSIRCSLNGIHAIMKYCKTEQLTNEIYVQKESFKDKPTLQNKNYNYRVNVKREDTLRKEGPEVTSFLNDFSTSKKHYRYKKRYSFLTDNNLFQIDLSIVKSSKYNPTLRRYELTETFSESKILQQPEEYEIEIEFLGNRTSTGVKHLSRYMNQLNVDGILDSTTSYQPLDPGLNYVDSQETQPKDEVKKLVGEYVIIKDEYLKTLDKGIFKRLSGQKISYVTDLMVIGELTYVMLDIPEMEQLIVPITDIYNEDWDSGESTTPYSIKVTSKLLESIQESYNDVLYHILCQISQTKILLSTSKQKSVLNDYYRLTKQSDRTKNVFMAPQPVTLTLFGLYSKNPIHILSDYAVTEKADGQRYLMYIDPSKHAYFIDTKLQVIDSGIDFPTIKGEWLLDGEYIRQDKQGSPIQLFMIFDVYLAERELNEYPQKLPFYDESKPCRENILSVFQNEYLSNISYKRVDFQPLRIFLKKYEYSTFETGEIVEPQKLMLLKSKIILDKQVNDGFEYEIDGLIYLPLRLPVKANSDGVSPQFINGAWEHNFKWKPPEENTIDFRIVTKKETITKNQSQVTRDKQIPFYKQDEDGNEVLEYYKQVELLVSYDSTRDDTLNYYLKMLEPFQKNKSKQIVFNPSNSDKNYGISRIELVNGKMICEKDKREIRDGDIVEMRFSEYDTEGFQWIPLRLRSDKQNPQWFLAANNVWSTITNPVTTNMIQGNIDLTTVDQYLPDKETSGVYYVEDHDTKTSDPLRKFHNFIKYNLITGICAGKSVRIMDTSIGRGGDLRKYIQKNFRCEFLLGLDLNRINEASRRYYYMQYKKPDAVFIRYNTGKNIIDKEGLYNNTPEFSDRDIEHSRSMIDILYGTGESVSNDYQKIRPKFNKQALKKFDIVSCQFSLHYYFESSNIFQGFLSNLRENIKREGYFIGTCYDGQRLFDLMKGKQEIEYKDKLGNLVYKIKKQYDIESLQDNLFGNQIDVYMDSIGEEYSEYLVDFQEFIKIMKENGFELQKPTMKQEFDIFEGPLNSFSTILEKLPQFKSNKEFMKYYKESLDMLKNQELSLLSSLNNFFIFQRVS